MSEAKVRVEVAGRELTLTNLDKVLYPRVHFTKGEVIDYYSRVADALLPHLAGRPLTRKRWPDGVDGPFFFEKNAPRGTPSWVRTVTLPVPGSTKQRETVDFVVVDDLAALVWTANLAALELHTPQWQVGPRGAVRDPDLLVVDLDPGPPAGLAKCLRVAVLVRDRLAADGLTAYPKTSGNKGMQLCVPISGRQSSDVVSEYAHRIAKELAAEHPDEVLSRMTKALRPGKVFLDWSQNNAAKTTVTPYSLRGREEPTVSTPLTWDEVAAGEPLRFWPADVLARLEEHGDLLAPLLERGPRVPTS
ncbi:MAG: bifunctional non-ous end joining protein LigD [Actinomycetota bacterium]|jgi:bifunctional non-homologous end joining protein LigD|nr:bifunctional non-ous end joining protein LigD [Actinomycetota bacterium]